MRTIMVLICLLFLSHGAAARQDLVVKGAVKETVLTGYTRSETTMVVSCEVGGRITQANYDTGLKIGEKPFYRIDTTFIDIEIQNTRKMLDKLGVLTDRIRSRISYLDKEFSRVDKLFIENSAPETRRDAAAEELAQARLELQEVEAEKDMTRLRLKELNERRCRHDIYAPKNWVVVEKMAETGEVVSPNSPLARVADFEHLVVPLSASGKEFNVVRRLPAPFDATLEGRPVKASLHRFNPEFDEKTRKLGIELILHGYDGEKRGGLVFMLDLRIDTDGLRVPKSTIINRYENPKVILSETGEAIQVLVLGETDGDLIIANHPSLVPGTILKPAE